MCTTDDIDYGSGGVMLLPESDITWPYMAVSGDKEGGIWFNDRSSPTGWGGDGTCAGGSNTNVQTFPIDGSLSLTNGPVIHNSPAYWKGGSPITSYIFMSSQYQQSLTGSGQLMRYQICTQGSPIRNSTSPLCTKTGAYAYTVTGTPLTFAYGTTPTGSATANAASDAIVWAIWSDGSVVPNTDRFVYPTGGHVFIPSTNGVLYAFDAANSSDANMKKLYSSNDCTIAGTLVDQINPATKFSVPTVANGFVYLGTQGARFAHNSNGSFPTNSDFNAGTFYIFGVFTTARGCSI
jgi:hypothetical protein